MTKEVITIDWKFKGDDTCVIIAEKPNDEQTIIKNQFRLNDEELCKAVALYVKLKSIPQRDINNLQVGDYVEFENLIHKTIKTIVFGEYELRDIKTYLLSSYLTDEDRKRVVIFPLKEFLEIWRELQCIKDL